MRIEPRPIDACRVCSSTQLEDILSLGSQLVSNFVESPEEAEIRVPLELVLCKRCNLLQLRHTTPPKLLYRQYWYKSGISPSMRAALADVTERAIRRVELKPHDIVIDIGANDGTLLRTYQKDYGLTLVGFEPAENLAKEARVGTDTIINDFFSYSAYAKIFGSKKAKIITAIAMFYDLDDPNSFLQDIAKCLHETGVFIIQMNYLLSMLEQNAFDNVCHEHLEYYSLTSLEYLLDKRRLEISDVELNSVNGGSFRIYIKHKGAKIKSFDGSEKRVRDLLLREGKARLQNRQTYAEFARRVEALRRRVREFIEQENSKGKTVYIRGASTRGNTTLQYFGLDHRLIQKAADRSRDKWGKFIVGTKIPIIPVEQAISERPDYFLVLPWHFLEELKEELKDYLKSGGRLLVPIPEFKVIGE